MILTEGQEVVFVSSLAFSFLKLDWKPIFGISELIFCFLGPLHKLGQHHRVFLRTKKKKTEAGT